MYCRKMFLNGGVGILVRKGTKHQVINLNIKCKQKTFKVCTLKLQTNNTKLIILCLYRAPTGDKNHFLNSQKM
jgi:hypothetical protein